MKPKRLSTADVRRSLSLSVFEGACYAVMVGLGEAYFIADAVRLGATSLQIGLLVGLPLAVGGLAATLVVSGLRRLRQRRPLTAGLVALQASVLLGLAYLESTDRTSAGLLLMVFCVHHACGQICGALWSSWYGDLVPAGIRGRYFARRARIVHLLTFVALVGGGLLLQGLEAQGRPALASGSGGTGFALLFLLAGGARLCSATLLLFSPEPRVHAGPRRGLSQIVRIPEQRGAMRVALIGCAVSFVVYFGAPFFGPHMLEKLRLDYRSFMLASAAQVAAKVLSLRAFGHAVDQNGAFPVFRLALLMVALVPLPWLWLDGLGWVVVAQIFSGVSWAAHEISTFGLLLSQSTPRFRSRVFAAQSLMNGVGQLAGTLCGVALVTLAGGSYLLAFAASMGGRLLVVLMLPVWLRQLSQGRQVGNRELLFRVVGLRPSGGLVHRPIGSLHEPDPGQHRKVVAADVRADTTLENRQPGTE